MNISRRSTIISFALLLSMLSPMLAQGACSQSDLTGVWYTFGNVVTDIVRCKIKVSSSENIVGSSSRCSIRDEDGRYPVDIPGGSVEVTDACKVTGEFQLCIEKGVCLDVTIENGRLERDKFIVTLEGFISADPMGVFSFVGVKK